MSDYTACVACGEEASGRHSLPVSETGDVVGVTYGGEWGGVPSCEACYALHVAATQYMDTGAVTGDDPFGDRFRLVLAAHLDATRELRRKLMRARTDLKLIRGTAAETLDDVHEEPDDGRDVPHAPIPMSYLLPAAAFRPGTRADVDGVIYRRSMDTWQREPKK
jgi:hypothetical protein